MAKHAWRIVATSAIILSFVTLFLPIIVYTNADGMTRGFNVLDIMTDNGFLVFVFSEYEGTFLYGLPYATMGMWAMLLSLVGIGAIALALVGINSMSKQYESPKPFRLAVLGLVGTAIPSLVLLALYKASASDYLGTMSLGAYIVVTPLAMVCALVAVTIRHRLTREEAQAQLEAAAYIRPAGDLPPLPGYYQGGRNRG